MRDDMAKVIVERPRGGTSSWGTKRGSKRFDCKGRIARDPDVLPKQMPTGFARYEVPEREPRAARTASSGAASGDRGTRCTPSIRARLHPCNTVQMHVLQHLYDRVYFARPVDGRTVLVRRDGRWIGELVPRGRVDARSRERDGDAYYVCATTGLLRRAAGIRRFR